MGLCFSCTDHSNEETSPLMNSSTFGHCTECGERLLPPGRFCTRCGSATKQQRTQSRLLSSNLRNNPSTSFRSKPRVSNAPKATLAPKAVKAPTPKANTPIRSVQSGSNRCAKCSKELEVSLLFLLRQGKHHLCTWERIL